MFTFNRGYDIVSKGNHVTIKEFPAKVFERDAQKVWNNSRIIKFFYDDSFTKNWFFKRPIRVPNFFLPDLAFMLNTLLESKYSRKEYRDILDAIYEKTWLKNTRISFPSRVDLKKLDEINYTLRPEQLEFLQIYDIKKQQYMLDGYLLAFEQGLGKALRNDTPIKTPSGWALISTLKVGDTVIAWDGTPTKITGVYPQGVKKLYRVHFEDDRYIDTDKEHLWKVYIQDTSDNIYSKVITTLDIKELLVSKIIKKIYIPLCKSHVKEDSKLALDPKTMGEILALHLFKKKNVLDNSSKEYLKTLGLLDIELDKKFIPTDYLNASIFQRKELLTTILKTKGCYTDNAIEYSSESKQFVKDLQFLVYSLGGKCRLIRETSYSHTKKCITYIAHITGLEKTNPIDDLLEITNITSNVDSDECTCIKIDHPDELYIAKDFIVTHNTSTSLALMHCLHKEAILVCAPKSTVMNVWVREINDMFKQSQDIWYIGKPFEKARFYIVNYESMDKLLNFTSCFPSGDRIGIIIDEWHNFRNNKAARVQSLLKLANVINCKDIVPMSGTPVKALGSELIPLISLLDSKFFDEEALELFKQAFGLNANIAFDVLRNRLGFMMFRKLKEDVLKLPDKMTEDIFIEFPEAKAYTLTNVKKIITEFTKERTEYYTKNKKYYQSIYQEGLTYFELNFLTDDLKPEYVEYLKLIDMIINDKFRNIEERQAAYVKANMFEKKIYTTLHPDLKPKWKKAKSVVKYVQFTIMGEVIGGLLTKLRSEMFTQMLYNSPIIDLINNAEKKTICFTSYVDVADTCYDYLKNNFKLKPLLAYGRNAKEIPATLKLFSQKSSKENPLIATIQTLSTGVTLTVANTVVFLNKPWRSVDYLQAQDRVHRVGQDTTCYIYNFILKTGEEANLSTRMEDIVKWSQEMFENIVGTKGTETIIATEHLIKNSSKFDPIDNILLQLDKYL